MAAVCKCRILIEADLDGYMLDNMMLEEMALQDVIQATTDDFACIVDKLKRNPNNLHLLHHAYELMQFMQTDNSFCLSDMDTDTYIEMMLASAGLSVKDVLANVFHSKTHSHNTNGGITAKTASDLAVYSPVRKGKSSYNNCGGQHG